MQPKSSLELQGNFQIHPFAELLAEIFAAKLSGSLRISVDEKKSIVYFDGGSIVFAVSNASEFRLAEMAAPRLGSLPVETLPAFSNDLELFGHLRKATTFSKNQLDHLLCDQVTAIITDILSWPAGDWVFNPLARARGDVRVDIDISQILLSRGRELPDDFVIGRFRTRSETFRLNGDFVANVQLDPAEGFLLSRIQGEPQTVSDIIAVSGMPDLDVFKILYSLWTAGAILRSNWNPAFSDVKISLIRSANLVLKKSSAPPVKPVPPPEPVVEEVEKAPEPQEPEITVDEYLARVESAPSLYDVLGLDHHCSLQDIRKSYFNLAKLFHPDHFHRAGPEQLRRVEGAFTHLAQAYETLKNPSSRKTYDSKHKRDLAEDEARRNAKASGAAATGIHADRAAQEFERGRGLLVEGNWEEALPFLTRAVHFAPNNAAFQAFYGKALSNDEAQRHKAVNAMQKAVTLEPKNLTFRMMLAEYLVTVNLLKRAEGELTRLLAIDPSHREAQTLLDSLTMK